MGTSSEPSVTSVDLDAPADAAPEAIALMHRAFAQYAAAGQTSGASLETVQTLLAEMSKGTHLGLTRVQGVPAALVKWRVEGDSVYFSRLGVDPRLRGRGLAAQLVRGLQAFAEEHHLAGLSCTVRAAEAGNIALYERLGMEIVQRGERASLTGAVIPVVHMRSR